MKLIFTLCLAACCLAGHGQTTKPAVPRDVYAQYQKAGAKIAALNARIVALQRAYGEDLKSLTGKSNAGKLRPRQAAEKRNALAVTKRNQEAALRQEVAAAELKRVEIERRYALPMVTLITPEAATKPSR